MVWRALFLSAVLVSPAFANAPERSIRPLPRGVSIQAVVKAEQAAALPKTSTAKRGFGLKRLFHGKRPQRPTQRPAGLKQKRAQQIAVSAKGSVCGVPEIKGAAIGAIAGRGACGVQNAVRLTSVSGVGLSQKPTIDCTTAKALNTWVKNGLKPAVGKVGGGVRSLKVVAHYACRNRNSAKSGRLSEHAKGRAVDISAINLNNGQTITVLKGWRAKQQGPILKKAHKAACGPFGTVLGPNANRFHQDHFHFDTARYRSGSYCR
ncbi:extensin family protein [uncultured Litoreibacter sp.]|uniref:extensin-like domain-containing protein n=1 Tax=uncultured Litoreibacter sp. TaxID=1392394 RepID=UPI0026086B35|nr:extensin family protein [uncultured Litoreibacter sp.]